MSNPTTVSDLRNSSVDIFQEAACQDTALACPQIAAPTFLGFQYLALEKLAGSPDEQKKKWSLSDLWHSLFSGHERAAYRQLEGDDLTPILVYKLGDGYVAADTHPLETARFAGMSFILAEVWEYPGR